MMNDGISDRKTWSDRIGDIIIMKMAMRLVWRLVGIALGLVVGVALIGLIAKGLSTYPIPTAIATFFSLIMMERRFKG